MTEGSLARHPLVARLFDAATDLYETGFRSKGRLTPPWRIRQYVGPFGDPREYERSAARQLAGLTSIGVVGRTTSVLDVGCGTGRLASALTTLLDPTTRYDGLDPQPIPVRWCKENISPRYPNFRFRETQTFSPKYNPRGTTPPAEYTFPFENGTFDLILLLSVLTHVGRDVEAALLRESQRVLRKNGRVVLTEYMLDPETRPQAEAGSTSPRFPYVRDGDRTQTPDTPEGFVARDSDWTRSLWRRLGLAPVVIRSGTWAARTGPTSSFATQYSFFQDFVVLAHSDP